MTDRPAPPNRGGRPRGEPSASRSIRLTRAQWAELDAHAVRLETSAHRMIVRAARRLLEQLERTHGGE